jgi:hypothetical protein
MGFVYLNIYCLGLSIIFILKFSHLLHNVNIQLPAS